MPDVLDHGYMMHIETWGSDEKIIEAARMSTGKGFNGWGPTEDPCPKCKGEGFLVYTPLNSTLADDEKRVCPECRGTKGAPGDEKLLRFLYENKHHTPFEMAGAIIEIKAPIFVFREWHRHRTQSYNEMSARYVPLPDENYVPSVERLLINSKTNRQAGTVAGAAELTEEEAKSYQAKLRLMYDGQEQFYQWALAAGVPKELARIHLPVGRYSRMRASANLRNWLGFLALRSTVKNPAAQWEIRQYADALQDILTVAFPRTMALFGEGKS